MHHASDRGDAAFGLDVLCACMVTLATSCLQWTLLPLLIVDA